MVVAQNRWFLMEKPIRWIWGDPYFRKPPPWMGLKLHLSTPGWAEVYSCQKRQLFLKERVSTFTSEQDCRSTGKRQWENKAERILFTCSPCSEETCCTSYLGLYIFGKIRKNLGWSMAGKIWVASPWKIGDHPAGAAKITLESSLW